MLLAALLGKWGEFVVVVACEVVLVLGRVAHERAVQ